MNTLSGLFDVTMLPQSDAEYAVGRMTIDKIYLGDVNGTGKGQMLSHMTQVKGSAGYVAVEKFAGKVAGKKGSFVLLHQGLMDKGAQSLNVTIIPDSGSGELAGISGSITIEIKDGKHFYHLTYQLNDNA